MDIEKVVNWLGDVLMLKDFLQSDDSLNGLQIARKNRDVRKMAFAVDACKETFERAVQAGADMLFVHHGLFWGKPIAITGVHFDRVAFALEHDLALFAAHLPLDAHPVFGNNAAMADVLGLVNREPFGRYHGVDIGVTGELEVPKTLQEIRAVLGFPAHSTLLPFGDVEEVRTVAIVSGGAAMSVNEAISRSVDLFITGEALHQIYHECQEHHIHFMAGGHYTTEVFGPRALGEYAGKELGIETQFIDVPTGL